MQELVGNDVRPSGVSHGFFDYDGTLVIHDTMLIPGHEAFVGSLDMSVITGQHPATFLPTLKKVPVLDRSIRMLGFNNGGVVFDRQTQEVIHNARFEEGMLERALGAIAECGTFNAITFTPEPTAGEPIATTMALYCQSEEAFAHYSRKYADGQADIQMIDGNNWLDHALASRPAMVWLHGRQASEISEQAFAGLPYHAYENGVHFMPSNSNKGTGMEVIADYLGIDLRTAVAAGNGDNDGPMLEHAGLGEGRSFFVGTDPVGDRLSSRVVRLPNQSDLGSHILGLMR